MSKQGNDAGNVHQLHRSNATRIEPPNGYEPPADRFMETADGVSLVRLIDVFDWVQRDRRKPRKAASDVICDALRPLEQEAREWLFSVTSQDYPRLVNGDAWYCDCMLVTLDGYVGCGSDCTGFPGLLRIVSGSWVSGPEHMGYGVGFDVCLPWAKANELWGWGRVVNRQAQAAEQLAPVGGTETSKQTHHKWTPEKRQTLLTEFNKAPGNLVKDKRAHVAKAWGIGEENVKKQLRLAKTANKPNFSSGLGSRKSTR